MLALTTSYINNYIIQKQGTGKLKVEEITHSRACMKMYHLADSLNTVGCGYFISIILTLFSN